MERIFCSASKDKVVLWTYSIHPFEITTSKLLATDFGQVSHISFCQSKFWNGIAFCVDQMIVLFDLDRQMSVMQLEGHASCVRQATFLHQEQLHLLSISDDRTFKIWNISDKKCIYSSSWIDSFVQDNFFVQHISYFFVGISLQWLLHPVNHSNQFFILSNGKLHQYEVKMKSHIKEIAKFPLLQWISKWKQKRLDQSSIEKQDFVIINSEPIWKQQHRYLEQLFSAPPITAVTTLEEKTVVGMEYISCFSSSFPQPLSILLICFTDCIMCINVYSMDILDVVSVDFQILQFTARVTDVSILAYCSNAFDPSINIISIPLDQLYSKMSVEDNSCLSIFATEPLKSSLQKEMVEKEKANGVAVGKKKKVTIDKPIVFHKTIKSSGYTSTPFMRKKVPKVASPSSTSKVSFIEPYNLNAMAPHKLDEKCVSKEQIAMFKFSNPICKLRMSYDGKYFVIGCSDYLVKTSKFPISQKNETHCIAYQSHQSAVHQVSWSYSNKYLLSSASDGKAVLWQLGEKEPILTFHNKVKNYGSKSTEGVFVGECLTNFFHVDQFVTITNSNKLYLYKYHIQDMNLDEHILNKEATPHKYKQASMYETIDQYFCAMSCINSFYSHLLFLATSNKNIELIDVNRNKAMRIIKDAHTRPIHTISLFESSQYVPFDYFFQMNETHNSPFLTSSLDGSIKMWDLRSDKCVRKFVGGHLANSSKIGCCFSPCMRFIATGSEDKCAYLYDVRNGTILHKLNAKCTDTISDVQFHPKTGHLITSSYDGSIRIFTS